MQQAEGFRQRRLRRRHRGHHAHRHHLHQRVDAAITAMPDDEREGAVLPRAAGPRPRRSAASRTRRRRRRGAARPASSPGAPPSAWPGRPRSPAAGRARSAGRGAASLADGEDVHRPGRLADAEDVDGGDHGEDHASSSATRPAPCATAGSERRRGSPMNTLSVAAAEVARIQKVSQPAWKPSVAPEGLAHVEVRPARFA